MDDLIAEFVSETGESLNNLDVELVRLEQDPGDKAILSNIFRIMHTIKGTCGFLGLSRLETVAHASENVVSEIRDGKITASEQAVSLILESLDVIKEVIGALQESGSEPAGNDSALISRLNAFATSGGKVAASEAPASAGEEIILPATQAGEEIHLTDPAPVMAERAKETAILEGLATEEHHLPAAVDTPQEVKGEKAGAGGGGAGAASNALIRVNLNVLESMMQMVSELVLTRNQLLQVMRSRDDQQLATPMQRLNYITSELQDNVMKTRMQPISNAWTKFPRLVRDLALEVGKKIELRMEGENTELDRQVLEMIKDPLTHMVRNSCDHGLELPEKRRAAGKSETGVILLRAYHEGGHIIIEITDDGNGIPVEKVRQKCISQGLVTEAQASQMTDQQVIQHIFQAGFSTAEKVTSVSGRGVGMDVVRSNIEKIGGTVEVRSQQGKGSTFLIKIPLTLAIVSVLIVEADSKRFALPQINVQEMVRVMSGGEYALEQLGGVPVLKLRERLLPVLYLNKLLGLDVKSEHEGFVAICRVGRHHFGLMVDRIYDTEEIVVKPMAPALRAIPLYSGATILGDGSVILILDPNGLAKNLGSAESQDLSDQMQSSLAQRAQDKTSRFLLFTTEDEAPKAVSLDLVSRLEEIDASQIEFSAGTPVLQYRGGLMRLITLTGIEAVPTEGIIEVVVFQYGNTPVGLCVKEIRDITNILYDIKIPSTEPWCLGGAIINDETTDIVDVGYLISKIMGKDVSLNLEELRPKMAVTPRVLLVEDSPFFIQLLLPVLEGAGYEVLAVESAERALNVLQQQSFDLIVTDIEMPDMNGIEFSMACKRMPERAAVPIIAFTSKTDDDTANLASQAGILAVVSKTDRESLLRQMKLNLRQGELVA